MDCRVPPLDRVTRAIIERPCTRKDNSSPARSGAWRDVRERQMAMILSGIAEKLHTGIPVVPVCRSDIGSPSHVAEAPFAVERLWLAGGHGWLSGAQRPQGSGLARRRSRSLRSVTAKARCPTAPRWFCSTAITSAPGFSKRIRLNTLLQPRWIVVSSVSNGSSTGWFRRDSAGAHSAGKAIDHHAGTDGRAENVPQRSPDRRDCSRGLSDPHVSRAQCVQAVGIRVVPSVSRRPHSDCQPASESGSATRRAALQHRSLYDIWRAGYPPSSVGRLTC